MHIGWYDEERFKWYKGVCSSVDSTGSKDEVKYNDESSDLEILNENECAGWREDYNAT